MSAQQLAGTGALFDAPFYRQVLPDRVTQECKRREGHVPAVKLQLMDGRELDLCHVLHLGDRWLAVQHFRDLSTCEDMDLTFLPYEAVITVTISMHAPGERRAGFMADRPAGAGLPAPAGVR